MDLRGTVSAEGESGGDSSQAGRAHVEKGGGAGPGEGSGGLRCRLGSRPLPGEAGKQLGVREAHAWREG